MGGKTSRAILGGEGGTYCCVPPLKQVYQKGLDVCYCLWGAIQTLAWVRFGPVQVPSRVRRSPVQICHVLCFAAFRIHPGPEVGAISRPVLVPSWSWAFLLGSGLDGLKRTSWPLPSLDRGKHTRGNDIRVAIGWGYVVDALTVVHRRTVVLSSICCTQCHFGYF